jgi:predicted transcriptional regulator
LTTITIRLEEEDKQILAELAKEQDLTISQLVRKAIKEYLAKQQKDK